MEQKLRAFLRFASTILACFFICLFSFSARAYADIDDTGIGSGESAETNPKTRTTTVTVSVRDHVAPSVPILVSPENNSILNVAAFPFVWKSSSDDHGISKYQLFLNGSVWQDTINTSLSGYSETGGVVTFMPGTILTDGTYTWKVRAVDTNGNTADSATWTFTIDTTPPVLLVTSIGNVEVSISSQDSETIPKSPIELSENAPTVYGTTDPDTAVTITIHYPSGDTEQIETLSDETGAFEATLPNLPKDVVLTLDFLSQDAAGNIAVISGVPIIIVTRVITFPPPISEIIPPIPAPPTPKEVREAVKEFITYPFIGLLVGLALPTLASLAVLSKTGASITDLSLPLGVQVLKSLALLPQEHQRGLVFDSATLKPVQYALVQIIRIHDGRIVGTSVTNKHGVYGRVRVGPGEYKIAVFHAEYAFPTNTQRSRFSTTETYYEGEFFTIHESEHIPVFLIPMDRKPESMPHASWRQFIYGTAHMPTQVEASFGILIWMAAIAFPSVWNIGMGVLYTAGFLKRVLKTYKNPQCIGSVLNQDASAVPYTPVVMALKGNSDVHITQSDTYGVFRCFEPSGVYTFTFSHPGYRQTIQEADLTVPQTYVVTLFAE